MKIKVNVRRFTTEEGSFINIKEGFIVEIPDLEKATEAVEREILKRLSFTFGKDEG